MAGPDAAALTPPRPDPRARHAASVRRAAPPQAARKPRRRVADARPALASIAPMRAVALARPATAPEDSAASHGDAAAAAPPAAAASGGGGNRGGAGSVGAAHGGAGIDPNSIAHADYASNPPPVYPSVARRREQQGTVTVRVLVGADGAVERAEVAESSGFDSLDDAALETVRSRWRFVPARHDGRRRRKLGAGADTLRAARGQRGALTVLHHRANRKKP